MELARTFVSKQKQARMKTKQKNRTGPKVHVPPKVCQSLHHVHSFNYCILYDSKTSLMCAYVFFCVFHIYQLYWKKFFFFFFLKNSVSQINLEDQISVFLKSIRYAVSIYFWRKKSLQFTWINISYELGFIINVHACLIFIIDKW